MHIVHVYKDYSPVLGGIENHLRVLAEGLAARGHRITVLVTNTAPRDSIIREGSLTVIKAARLLHLASTPLSPRMAWLARTLSDADIVHLHFPYPPGDLAALLVPGHPPLVVTYHSDIVRQRLLLQAYRPLMSYTLRRAACILATSPAYIASSPWLRPHAERCRVSPLSVDLSRFDRVSQGLDPAAVQALRGRFAPPLLLFVGRLRYYKGLHFLLEALALMEHRADLLLVGTGPEEARLRSLALSAQVAERVHFLGEVSDEELPAVYHAADAFVLPSHLRSEAFGIVQLEAQAAELPIVCTELGTGTSYITQHEQTGLVVPPADVPALAQALDTLVANPELARQMGQAGRQRATDMFSHTRMLERTEAVYRDVTRKT